MKKVLGFITVLAMLVAFVACNKPTPVAAPDTNTPAVNAPAPETNVPATPEPTPAPAPVPEKK